MAELLIGSDGVARCPWPGSDPLYVAYHDDDWGRPVRDERELFEKLILDGAQAGLAWITILRKRDGYRQAFDGFDPERVAAYGPGRRRAAARRSGHRPQSAEGRRRDLQCAGAAGDA